MIASITLIFNLLVNFTPLYDYPSLNDASLFFDKEYSILDHIEKIILKIQNEESISFIYQNFFTKFYPKENIKKIYIKMNQEYEHEIEWLTKTRERRFKEINSKKNSYKLMQDFLHAQIVTLFLNKIQINRKNYTQYTKILELTFDTYNKQINNLELDLEDNHLMPIKFFLRYLLSLKIEESIQENILYLIKNNRLKIIFSSSLKLPNVIKTLYIKDNFNNIVTKEDIIQINSQSIPEELYKIFDNYVTSYVTLNKIKYFFLPLKNIFISAFFPKNKEDFEIVLKYLKSENQSSLSTINSVISKILFNFKTYKNTIQNSLIQKELDTKKILKKPSIIIYNYETKTLSINPIAKKYFQEILRILYKNPKFFFIRPKSLYLYDEKSNLPVCLSALSYPEKIFFAHLLESSLPREGCSINLNYKNYLLQRNLKRLFYIYYYYKKFPTKDKLLKKKYLPKLCTKNCSPESKYIKDRIKGNKAHFIGKKGINRIPQKLK